LAIKTLQHPRQFKSNHDSLSVRPGVARAWPDQAPQQTGMFKDALTQLSHCLHNCCKLLARFTVTIQRQQALECRGFGFCGLFHIGKLQEVN
jgi:hypothetical protein